ncbi:MAG: OmpA family protein [Bacteroidales bacterium]
MRLIITGVVFISIIAVQAKAQLQSQPSGAFEEAYEFLEYGEYTEALPLFLSLYREEKNNYYLSYLTGVSYLNIEGQKQRALPYLEEAAENISLSHKTGRFDEKSAPAECLYYLGVAYRLAYRFEESEASFVQLKNILEDRYDMSIADREAGITRNAAMFYNNRESIVIKDNHDLPATDPLHRNIIISGDESTLVYTEPQKFYDAVYFAINNGNEWSSPLNITMQIGSDGLAYPAALSFDGSKLYLYQYDGFSNTNLYVSSRENDRWSAMKKLNENINSKGFEQHASVTRDGGTIYFASNRLSGKGGFDIYRSNLDEDKDWGPAENLGYPVNSRYDDSFPFISPDGKTLFFSSEGHTTMGGYDIFVTHQTGNGDWSPPRNLGYPVNTPDDDSFLIPLEDEDYAYINLREEGNNDIRNLHKIHSFDISMPAASILTINPTFESDKYGDSLIVNILVRPEDNPDSILLHSSATPGKDHNYELTSGDYLVNLSSPGHYTDSFSLSIPEYYPEEQYFISAELRMIEPAAEIPGHTGKTIDTVIIEIPPVFFGFDSHDLNRQSLAIISEVAGFMDEYMDVSVDLRGYTDAMGPAAYNKYLAGLRAKAVEDALTKTDVDKSRITITAVGMDNYIARNITAEGRDNPEGRKYNRRVEFVFGNLPPDIKIIDKPDIPEYLKNY